MTTTGEWVFASYLIRVRVQDDKILPQFASDFLGTNSGRLQIDRFSRQIIGMTNINAEELREIVVPLPNPDKQRELVAAMDKARALRRAKLAQADALLAGLDGYLQETLGLTSPQEDGRRVFAVTAQGVREQSHLNPDFFHPERIQALRAMGHAAKSLLCCRLDTVVDFVRDQIKSPGDNYLSLAHVQSHTGELVAADESAIGACFTFQTNDVLFARLRPYLNKVHRTETGGCCSPEFHVLRIKAGIVLLPDYLATILRSGLILAQTRHMMTGNTHPRLANEDVVNLVIPIPDIKIQEQIAAEVRRRREESRALRTEAEAGWQAAKAWFEAQLLGDAAQGAISDRLEAAGTITIPTRRYGSPTPPKTTGGQQSRTHDGASRHISDDAPLYPLAAETPATAPPGGEAALPVANQPVPARLFAAMQPGHNYSRAELLTATGIIEGDWTWAIRQLKEEGLVVQEGEKCRARYRRK